MSEVGDDVKTARATTVADGDAEPARRATIPAPSRRVETLSPSRRATTSLTPRAVSTSRLTRAVQSSRPRRVTWIAAAVVVAWPLAAWAAARALVVSEELDRAEAVVVLAGSPDYVARTRRAAEIFREGRAQRVVLTDDGGRAGWSEAEGRNPPFVELAARELEAAGVPRERIEIAPGTVSGTREEALRLREYARGRGYRSLLVVTSPYHARRALWTFRRALGGSGVAAGLSPCASDLSPLNWWLTPRGWKSVAGEYVKLAYYGARY